MQRRKFLTNVGAVGAAAGMVGVSQPLLAAQRTRGGGRPLRIGVVGGGIVGACTAMHLAQAGAQVTLFEKTAPAAGATRASLAMMHVYEPDKHFQALRLQSFLYYRELDYPLQLNVTWGGSVLWATDPAENERLRTIAGWVEGLEIDGLPYAARTLDAAEFARICGSCIDPGAMTAGIHSPIDGHVDPVWVTLRFLDQARLAGAKVIFPCEVQQFEHRGNRLAGVVTTQGKFALDRVVIASGADSPRLTSMLGYQLPLLHSPGMTAHSVDMPSFTKMAFNGPDRTGFKQLPTGEIVAEVNYGSPPDLPQHAQILKETIPYPSKALEKRHAEIVFSRVSKYFTCARAATPREVRLGFRPMPKDRNPVMGAVPGTEDVYLAVTREGVSLAAIVGRYVTQELLTGTPAEMFAPYRPTRFL